MAPICPHTYILHQHIHDIVSLDLFTTYESSIIGTGIDCILNFDNPDLKLDLYLNGNINVSVCMGYTSIVKYVYALPEH